MHQFAPNYTRFHRNTLTCPYLHQVAPSCTKLPQSAPSSTKFTQSAPSCTKLNQPALSCTSYTKLHQTTPSCPNRHQVAPMSTKLPQIAPNYTKASLRNCINFSMQSKNSGWSVGGIMFTARKNGIPVSLLQSHSSLWEASSRAEHDIKLCDWWHFQSTCSSDLAVEPRNPQPISTRNLRRCDSY